MGVRGSRASLFLCFFQRFPVKVHFSSGLWKGQGSGPPFEGTSSLRFHYVWEYINRTQRDNGQWSENPTASLACAALGNGITTCGHMLHM